MSRTTGNGQTPVTIDDHKHLVLRWAKISVFEPQGHDLDIAQNCALRTNLFCFV